MQMTTTGSGTAARIFRGTPYLSAGKTGTAQVVNRGARAVDPRSLPLWKRHRGLYIGYAPADDPRIAIAIAVEGGGFGADSAAPIARKVFDAWLLGKAPAPVAATAEAEGAPPRPDFSNVVGSPVAAPPPPAAPVPAEASR
jgi:penicillin-binding protein 2